MKPIGGLLVAMLLHHLPGVCAPADDGRRSDGRVRQHLLGTMNDVVAVDTTGADTDTDVDTHERMVNALTSGANHRADLLRWAAREAIGAAQWGHRAVALHPDRHEQGYALNLVPPGHDI